MSTFSKLAGSLLAFAFANLAHAVSLDFASLANSTINFNGNGTFSFSAAPNFQITSGTATGMTGTISGIYSIGAVTSISGVSTAPVTGTGQFTIHGVNPFVADLTWTNIFQFQSAGSLNFESSLNMTNISYGGSNLDLLAIKSYGAASNVLTFQFTPAVSLAKLKTTRRSTSFSGSVTAPNVPDGGYSLLFLGSALVGLAFFRRKLL